MSEQLDMFADANPLIGIEIKMSRRCRCQHDLFVVGEYRWFRSPNVVCLEQYRRRYQPHKAQYG